MAARLPKRLILEESKYVPGKAMGVMLGGQQSSLSIKNDFRDAAMVTTHDGQPSGLSFSEDHSQGFSIPIGCGDAGANKYPGP